MIRSTDLWPVTASVSCKARRYCWTSARRCWRCAGWCCWSSPCWPDQPEPHQRSQSSYSLQGTEQRAEKGHETQRNRHNTQHSIITFSPYTPMRQRLNDLSNPALKVFIGLQQIWNTLDSLRVFIAVRVDDGRSYGSIVTMTLWVFTIIQHHSQNKLQTTYSLKTQ